MSKTHVIRGIAIISPRFLSTCAVAALALPMIAGAVWGGSVVAWGQNNNYGQCNVPPPNGGFAAVAGGEFFSLGLKSDGSIVGWGQNDHGECNIPSPNSGFTSVAAGGYHGLAIRSDGSVAAWGYNTYSQCNVPAPNSGYIAVEGGKYHSLGLRTDGSIAAWGDNTYGQCNAPDPNSGFIGISCGNYHNVGLKSDGSIAAWGDNTSGQCDIPSPNSGFTAVVAFGDHNLGMKSDGSIVAWGWNQYGQCNVPAPNSGFVAVSAGMRHSVAIKSDGSIVAWGYNNWGQGSAPSPNTGFVAVAAGGWHNLGITGPTVTVNKADDQADPVTAAPIINFTVVFAEPVTDFATGDVTLSGTAGATTATVTGFGTTYNVAVSGMTTTGTVTASIAGGVAHDVQGYPNSASTSTDNTVMYYHTGALSVTINQAADQADFTQVSPVNFTVVFSAPVEDFATGDVAITGTAGGVKTRAVTGSGATYNVAVSGMTTTGTIIASISAGVAHAAGGNANFASTSTDNMVVYVGDFTGSLLPGTSKAAYAVGEEVDLILTNMGVVPRTWGNYCEIIWDCFIYNASLSLVYDGRQVGCSTEYNPVTIQPGQSVTRTGPAFSVPGIYYFATSSPPNRLAPFVVDNTPLTVAINQASGQADPTMESPINFAVVFSEAVTDFVTGDVKLSGTAGATTAVVTGSGTTYNVAVSGMTSNGTVIASIPGGVAHDATGIPSVPSTSADNSVTRGPANPRDAKKSSDGSQISAQNVIVSAAFDGFFYIESDDRACGIRVDKTGHTLTEGMRVDVFGTLGTTVAGERYIQAGSASQSAAPNNTGHVGPLVLSNRAVGGADLQYVPGSVWPRTASGQKGVTGGGGPNNIGLLVTIFGEVTVLDTSVPAAWIRVDDGSGVGVKVTLPTGMPALNIGSYVRATGVSACEKPANDVLPLLLLRTISGSPDFAVLADP